MFGLWGRRIGAASDSSAPGADGGAIASLASAVGVTDVSWAPLPADACAERRKEPLPYDLKQHDVKAHLRDRSTAVVEMRTVVDAPYDVMWELLADPHQHEHVFDAIESARAELVSEEGPVRRWRLDYRARWKFWKVGGVCDNRLWMTTDRERGTVSFELREPGFLRTYEGTWTITGPHGKGPAGPGAGAGAASGRGGATAAAAAERRQQPQQDEAPPSPSASTASAASADDADAGGATPRSFALTSRSLSSISSRSSSIDNLDRRSAAADGDDADAASPNGTYVSGSAGREQGAPFASIGSPLISDLPLPHLKPKAAAAASPSPSLTEAASTADAGEPAEAAAPAVPRFPTTIVVHKAISPKVAPPFPINQVLKGHASGQVQEMLEGLLLATAHRAAEVAGGGGSSAEAEAGAGAGAGAEQVAPA